MTVAELIAELQKMPADAPVWVWCEYDGDEATKVRFDPAFGGASDTPAVVIE